MLAFAQNWSWLSKAFIAMLTVLPIMVVMPVLQNRYGLKSESFFITWFLGSIASFIFLAKISPSSISSYFTPIGPVLFTFFLAFVLGGPGNMLLIQAMDLQAIKPASNSALPFAIVGLASTCGYALSYFGSKILPAVFPAVKFNSINIGGLLFIAIGVAAVMYQK